MITVLLIGLVAGLITGISPCVLPVLPAVLMAGGATAPGRRGSGAPPDARMPSSPPLRPVPSGAGALSDPGLPVPVPAVPASARTRRSVALVAGLVVSFSVLTLAGSAVLTALHLPQGLLRDLGLAALAAAGLGFVVPALGDLLERPFLNLRGPAPRPAAAGFVVGLALGAVYVPCAGPVLAALAVIAATHRLGFQSALLMLAFSVGAGVPLLVVALAGGRLVERARWLNGRAAGLRAVGGGVLIATAAVVAFNLTDGLQRAVPGYTNALQQAIEGTAFARTRLNALTGEASAAAAAAAAGRLTDCNPEGTTLEMCGDAPAFADIQTWLNTPGGAPLTMAGLRGDVVLVDFWTYSCINCQRSLPHVEAWYKRYSADGFVVVGVHTPEFSFEHVVSNVRQAAAQLGVLYPIAIDNDYGTWTAYDNEYWPAEYLIDASGVVRHVDFGEGGYSTTEDLIRQLLTAAHPGIQLPPPVDVPDLTPTEPMTSESYLGYDRLDNLFNGSISPGQATMYDLPSTIPLDALALGGTWTIDEEEMTAGAGARLALHFEADDVYLVLGGQGTLQVSVNGGAAQTMTVSGIPRLYTMVKGTVEQNSVLQIQASPGIQAYDFTFG